MADSYHSVYLPRRDARPQTRWESLGSTVFQHDIMSGPLPDIYDTCDVLYAELPWRAGFVAYNERAGISDGRTYRAFMASVSAIVQAANRATVIVTGRHAAPYLPTPTRAIPVMMPVLDQEALAYMFNLSMSTELPMPGTVDLLAMLERSYRRVGDFCCGYGGSLRAFAEAGKAFVGSDYNRECIGYVAKCAPGWIKSARAR